MIQSQLDGIVRMVWEDKIYFDEIKLKTSRNEAGVIKIMRQQLKSYPFHRWGAHNSDRAAKHR
ncbi:DUF2805 domain-containing protein [Verrucomicrobiales bacterium]|nr:DUF2805 domain-containing protein [bacterium]MDB4808631.1 DUF2805 domain-containing protein [Verrucomicrobiales bacterium]